MLEGLLAAAGIITLASSVYAWICDALTEQQRERQQMLYRRRNATQARFQDELNQHEASSATTLHEFALEIKRMLEDELQHNLSETLPVRDDLVKLRHDLAQQLQKGHISPFKRNALQMLSTRLDDAINRFDAFQSYCDWYARRLDILEQAGQYEDLIEFDLPEAKLPEEWFYVGKVGLVGRDDLNRCSNRFEQMLQLTHVRTAEGFAPDAAELMLAQLYPEQEAIPIQLVHVSKKGNHFSASILRGSLFVDHILQQVPCKAVVEKLLHGTHEGYRLRCFPDFLTFDRERNPVGGIVARLSRSEARYPGKKYQTGDTLQVYPMHYDLLLKDDRGGMTVTERPESLQFEQESVAPIYLVLDSDLPFLDDLASALEGDAQWQLRSCRERQAGQLQIDFQLGNWLVSTVAAAGTDYLVVREIGEADQYDLDRTSLPFDLQVIERALLADTFIDKQQFLLLCHFCQQQALYEQRDAHRARAWQFFERWNTVANYLLEVDGYIIVPLSADSIDALVVTATGDEELAGQMKLLSEQVEDELKRNRRPRIPLELACLGATGALVWLQISELTFLPELTKQRQIAIELGPAKQKIAQLERLGFTPMTPSRLRLRVRRNGDHQNLMRQKRALESFVLDRMSNKALKQIVIDPAGYVGQPDPRWQQKVATGLAWRNPDWQAPGSATSAKTVIEQALVESNLYLVQGPPGTGKTTCIVEMLHQLYADNPMMRVLVVSQQNTAVDNALTRFLQNAPQFEDLVLRVGKEDKMDDSLIPFGTERRLRTYHEGRQAALRSAMATHDVNAPVLQDWLASIYDDAQGYDSELSEILMGEFQLVGATCVGLAGQRHGMHRQQFDIAIIDEAGRCTVPELLIPLLRTRKVILIGDHFQLPPSIAATLREEDTAQALPFLEDSFLKESFFEIMFRGLPAACRGRLDQQFRMAAPIGDLVAELFYQIDGKRGLFNGRQHDCSQYLDPDQPIQWRDIRGRQKDEGTSKSNLAEAQAIVEFLHAANVRLAERKLNKSVAIITPYGAQKRLIRQQIDRATNTADKWQALKIRVDTVDSFQGSEADIVLYSTVRTAGDISFIRDRQRLNVSCSRARETLVFFGNAHFLRQAEDRLQSTGATKLFSAIMQKAVHHVMPIRVTVSHVPKEGSSFLFAGETDGASYFVHYKAAKNLAWRDWCALKVNDVLEITLVPSTSTSSQSKYPEAATVKVLAASPALHFASPRQQPRRQAPGGT